VQPSLNLIIWFKLTWSIYCFDEQDNQPASINARDLWALKHFTIWMNLNYRKSYGNIALKSGKASRRIWNYSVSNPLFLYSAVLSSRIQLFKKTRCISWYRPTTLLSLIDPFWNSLVHVSKKGWVWTFLLGNKLYYFMKICLSTKTVIYCIPIYLSP